MKRPLSLLLIVQIFLVQGARAHACAAHGHGGADPHVHLSALGAWFAHAESTDHDDCPEGCHHQNPEQPTPHDDNDAVTLPDGILHACETSAENAAAKPTADFVRALVPESTKFHPDSAARSTFFIACVSRAGDRCAHLIAQLHI